MKNIRDIFFLILIFFQIIFFSEKIFAENLEIKNIIFSKPNQLHILFNQDMTELDLNYDNFEKFITIDPFLKINCGWFNLKTSVCKIINYNEIIAGKIYSIKIDSKIQSKNGLNLLKDYKKEINFNEFSVRHLFIENWINKEMPIIKIIFDDFVEKKNILEKIKLINKNSGKTFYLKEFVDSSKYIDDYEKEEDKKNLEEKFKDFSEDDLKNFKEIYKKRIVLQTISIIDANQEFDLILDDAFNNDRNNNKKKLLSFKTFSRVPEFLGIECENYKHKLITIPLKENLKSEENTEGEDKNEKKCLSNNGGISLLFSTPFDDDEIFNNLKFNWQINKDKIKEDKKHFYQEQNSNPYKFFIPIFEANKKYQISFSKKKKYSISQKLKNLFNGSGINSKKIFVDIFGDEFLEEFIFNFESANEQPIFNEKNFNNILNISKFKKDESIFYSNNIKNYEINYDLVKANIMKKNQVYKKNLDNLKENNLNEINLGIGEIFGNDSGILIGDIIANPIEDKLYKPIKNQIFIQNTSIDLIARIWQNSLLLWALDLKTNENLKNADVQIKQINFDDFKENNFEDFKLIASGKTNENGIFNLNNLNDNNFLDSSNSPNDKLYLAEVKKENEIAWLLLIDSFKFFDNEVQAKNEHFYSENKFKNLVFLGFSDSFIYEPGDKVNFKVYIKDLIDDPKINKIDYKKLKFNLFVEEDISEKIIYSQKNLDFSNKANFISGSFILSKENPLGKYNIIIEIIDPHNNNKIYKIHPFSFDVKFFEKVNFKTELKIEKEQLLLEENFDISLRAEYYSTLSGLKNAKLKLICDAKEKSFSEENNFKNYIFNDDAEFFYKKESYQIDKSPRILFLESKLNEGGEFLKNFNFEKEIFPYGTLNFQSTIFDENGKSISKKKEIEYFGSKIFIGAKINGASNRFLKNNELIDINFISLDYKKNLIPHCNINILIEKNDDQNQWIRILKLAEKTNENGIGASQLKLKESGRYRIIVFAKENPNNQFASFDFFLSNENNISHKKDNLKEIQKHEIEIISPKNKQSFFIGDQIKFIIKNPFYEKKYNSKALILIENASGQKSFIKNFDKEFEFFDFDVTEDLIGGFFIQIFFTSKSENEKEVNKFQSIRKKINIIEDSEKINSLKVFSEKEIYKPGEEIIINFENNNFNINEKTIGNQDEDNSKNLIQKNLEIENEFECTFIAMNKYIFDMHDKNSVENFDLFKKLISAKLFFSNSQYHLFKKINTNLIFNDFVSNRGAVFMTKNSNDIEILNSSSLTELIGAEDKFKKIIHFENSITFDKNEKIKKLKFKSPEASGSFEGITICQIPNKNYFFTKFNNFKVIKDIEIEEGASSKSISPGEKLNFQFSIINHNFYKQENQKKIKLTLRMINEEIGDLIKLNLKNKKEDLNSKEKLLSNDKDLKSFIEKNLIFDQENKRIDMNLEILLKDEIKFDNNLNEKNIIFEFNLFEKNEFGDEILVEKKNIDFLIRMNEIKKTILEDEMINTNEFSKTFKLPENINQSKSKINISISETILNNIENLLMIVSNYDDNLLRTNLSKIMGAKIYEIFGKNTKFNNLKIFENFKWDDSVKTYNHLIEQIQKYKNDSNEFREIINDESFKENPELALKTLFVFNFIEKIDNIKNINLKQKNDLTKYLFDILKNQKLDLNKKSYILHILSEANSLLDSNYLNKIIIQIIQDELGEINLESKIRILYAFLNLNESNLKNANFISSEFEKILDKYGVKNGNFISIAESSYSSAIINFVTLSFLVDFDKKFKNSSFKNDINFNFDMPFLFAKTILNRDFKINYNNPNQTIEYLNAFFNYAMIFESNENKSIDSVNFKIWTNDRFKLNLNEKINLPNYIEIENIGKFLNNDINLSISKFNHQEEIEINQFNGSVSKETKKMNKDIIYFSLKLDLFEKILFNDLNLSEKILNNKRNFDSRNFSGIEFEKEYYKYNLEDGSFSNMELKNSSIKKNDIVKIILKFTTNEEKKFILIEDIIPNFAKFYDQNVFLNEKVLNFSSLEVKNNFFSPILNENFIRFYKEILPKGDYEIIYYIRVNSSGNFLLEPAIFKEIYNPEIFAITSAYKNFVINE